MITALYASPVLLLTLTAMMWAMNAIIGQLAVGEIAPSALVLLRWLMVAAVMWPLHGREIVAHWPKVRARLGLVAFMAAAGFTGFNTVFYIASAYTSGINVGIIQGAMPVLVLLGAFAVYGERIGLGRAAGVAITLVGVLVLASRGDPQVLLDLAFNRGDVLMLGAALLYSAYTVAIRARPEMPGAALFTVFAIVAAATAVPLAVWEATRPGYAWPTPTGWGLTVLVAIFPSCLAQLFFMRGVDLIGPGRAGVFINLVPVFAAALAVLLLGERFGWHHAAALTLVLAGLWLAQRGR